ncbi:MAG TPA: PAS domain S-box protein [Acidimicrobiales bacterium]|jgi:PAS domain S-box-containing protein|nr:PAS domain S-box protein [Acidimicrobiales bacterium]
MTHPQPPTETLPARFQRGAGELPDEVFRMIVDMTAHPFVVIDLDGMIRYAGGSIEKVLGWPAEQVAGRNMIEFLPPDQVELAVAAIGEIESVDRDGDGVPMVFQIRRADGELAWVEIGAIPLLDVPGLDAAIVLRERVWDGQYWFDKFVGALLADEPLDDVLSALCRSIAATLEATVSWSTIDSTAPRSPVRPGSAPPSTSCRSTSAHGAMPRCPARPNRRT